MVSPVKRIPRPVAAAAAADTLSAGVSASGPDTVRARPAKPPVVSTAATTSATSVSSAEAVLRCAYGSRTCDVSRITSAHPSALDITSIGRTKVHSRPLNTHRLFRLSVSAGRQHRQPPRTRLGGHRHELRPCTQRGVVVAGGAEQAQRRDSRQGRCQRLRLREFATPHLQTGGQTGRPGRDTRECANRLPISPKPLDHAAVWSRSRVSRIAPRQVGWRRTAWLAGVWTDE